VIQRVTQDYNGVDNKRFFLIEAHSVKQAWPPVHRPSEPDGSAVFGCCRHSHCRVCEEWSVTKAYSDYWICHCCGALTKRVSSLH